MAPGWCSCGQGWYRGRGVCTAGTDGVNGTHSGPVRQHRERRRALQHNAEEMEMRVEDTDCEESERPPPSAVELVVAEIKGMLHMSTCPLWESELGDILGGFPALALQDHLDVKQCGADYKISLPVAPSGAFQQKTVGKEYGGKGLWPSPMAWTPQFEMLPFPPMAPSMMPLPPGLSDSSGLWNEGWHKGNKEGYNEGYQDGSHAGRVSTQPGSSDEEAQEESSASSKQKQRKKKKKKKKNSKAE